LLESAPLLQPLKKGAARQFRFRIAQLTVRVDPGPIPLGAGLTTKDLQKNAGNGWVSLGPKLRRSSHLQNVSLAIDLDVEFSSQHIEPCIVA